MALAARLIESLAVTGSRKADGTVNASGKVFLYEPGTNTTEIGYTSADLSEAWTLEDGGIPLDVAGKAAIWVQAPCDIRIEDSDGAELETLEDFNKVGANQVEVLNDLYTGAVTDDVTGEVTQDLGGQTDLDTVLTNLAESLGPDGEYQESAGATQRSYIEVVGDIAVSAKDFGADPAGLADSTSALQQAADRCIAREGSVLLVPTGTYKTSSVVSLVNATGVRIIGAGQASSIIRSTSSTQNLFALSGCTDCAIENLSLTSGTATTGTDVALTSCVRTTLRHVSMDGGAAIGVSSATACSDLRASDCIIIGSTTGLQLAAMSYFWVKDSFVQGTSTAAFDLQSTTQYGTIFGCIFNSGTGVRFNANLTGLVFTVANSPTLSTITPWSFASGVDPYLRQWGNQLEHATLLGAIGSTLTPVLLATKKIRLVAASGGAGTQTVATPTVAPTYGDDRPWTFEFVNGSGGAVTWALSSFYKLVGAAAPASTDAHTIEVLFTYDATAQKMREIGRGDTTT